MKKLTPLALFFMIQSAHASQELFFDGFMLQAAIGASTGQYNLTQNIESTINSLTTSVPDNVNLFANSPTGLLYAGYSYQMDNNFLLAAGLTAAYTDAKSTDHLTNAITIGSVADFNLDSQTITQLTNDFAVLFKAGYVWKRTTVFYGLLGPRWGNFKTEIKADLNDFNGVDTFTASASEKMNEYQLGVTFGLGIQQLLTPRYSWALEYAYTTYGNIHTPKISTPIYQDGVAVADSSFVADPKIDASSNTVLFYIAYRI